MWLCTCVSVSGARAASDSLYRCQVTLRKPLGFTLARGNDAAAYVQATDPKAGNTDERIQVRGLRMLPACVLVCSVYFRVWPWQALDVYSTLLLTHTAPLLTALLVRGSQGTKLSKSVLLLAQMSGTAEILGRSCMQSKPAMEMSISSCRAGVAISVSSR